MSSDPTAGVLSLHSSKESKAILNAADDLGFDTAWLRGENTVVDISDGEVRLEPEVDILVNRLLLSKEEQPAEALGLATTLDRARPMLNTPTATMTRCTSSRPAPRSRRRGCRSRTRCWRSLARPSTLAASASARRSSTRRPSAPTAAAPGSSIPTTRSTPWSAPGRRSSRSSSSSTKSATTTSACTSSVSGWSAR